MTTLAPVYRILVGTRSESDLIECLRSIERDEMGLGASEPDELRRVVQKLLALSVNLNPEFNAA